MNNFYFSYPGNKRQEYKEIKNYIPPCSVIVEPFSGTGAISRAHKKEFPNVQVHLNDLNKFLINFYKHIQNNELNVICDKLIKYDGINKNDYNIISKNRKKLNFDDIDDLVKELLMYKFYLFRAGTYPSDERKLKFENIIHSLKNNSNNEFIKKCKLTNQDYKIIFEEYKNNENAFLFLDPPYMESDNSNYSDGVNNCQSMYENIYNFINSCKCKVMIVVNDCFLNRLAFKDKIKFIYGKKYEVSKKKVQHLIISNY